MNRKEYIYNQNISNTFSSDCTIFTMAQIFGLQYWVWLKYTFINKVVDFFIKIALLFNWWASFSAIYPAAAKNISNRIKEDISVYKIMINSTLFEEYLNKWYYFWLWLKNGNPTYLKQVRDGKPFTFADIDKIVKQGGWFWHNHCYGKEWDKYYIYEIYEWKKIEMPLWVLRYAVSQNLYFAPARTFVFNDKEFEDLIMRVNKWERIDYPKEKNSTYYKLAKINAIRVFGLIKY